MTFWANLIGYQAVWFCVVIGAGRGLWWPGVAAAAAFVAWQFAVSDDRRRDLRVLAAALVAGAAIESVLAASGLLAYAAPWPSVSLAPAWIVALWGAFAMTVGVSLAFLQRSLALAAVFGAVGGPLAYLGAARGFDAVAFAAPTWAGLLAVGVGWAVAMPLLAAVARTRRAARPLTTGEIAR